MKNPINHCVNEQIKEGNSRVRRARRRACFGAWGKAGIFAAIAWGAFWGLLLAYALFAIILILIP